MNIIGQYQNGNFMTYIYEDGTRVRETEAENFIPAFASNMDVKICNRCDMGCKYCHEGSTPDGELGDIMNEQFVNTLHKYQEVALGGGNVFEHPDLIPFLYKLKGMGVIVNITLNQRHFEKDIDKVEFLVKEKLIYGLGISLMNPTEEFITKVQKYPNAVIHVINGIFTEEDCGKLINNNLKLLILGYKTLRKGTEWLEKDFDNIVKNQNWLFKNISNLTGGFKVVSFDNLAIEQLDMRQYFNDEEWELFYAGDDGTQTYYIDMVERKFAKSSTSSFDKRYKLMDSVDDMFKVIVGEDND